MTKLETACDIRHDYDEALKTYEEWEMPERASWKRKRAFMDEVINALKGGKHDVHINTN